MGVCVYIYTHTHIYVSIIYGLPWWLSGKGSTCQCRRHRRPGFNPWVRKILWKREWQPTPVFLPGEFHGWRSLAGYSPWGCKEPDTIERTKFLSIAPQGTDLSLSTLFCFSKPLPCTWKSTSGVGRGGGSPLTIFSCLGLKK